MGGVVGIAVAMFGVRALVALSPQACPRRRIRQRTVSPSDCIHADRFWFDFCLSSVSDRNVSVPRTLSGHRVAQRARLAEVATRARAAQKARVFAAEPGAPVRWSPWASTLAGPAHHAGADRERFDKNDDDSRFLRCAQKRSAVPVSRGRAHQPVAAERRPRRDTARTSRRVRLRPPKRRRLSLHRSSTVPRDDAHSGCVAAACSTSAMRKARRWPCSSANR